MNTISVTTNQEGETFALGETLGRAIEQPIVIFLSGTLGTGKTRLTQAIASGLGIPQETVNSPTFTIMVPHSGRLNLVHVDAYRIKDLDEAEQLGIDDWVDDGCVLVVEWAERIAAVLPEPDLVIQIESQGQMERNFSITPKSQPGEQICAQLEPP